MPRYDYSTEDGEVIEQFFPAAEVKNGEIPKTIERGGKTYTRVFSMATNIFVETMERRENMEILRAMDQMPNQMVLDSGLPTGKSNEQLASEGILKPLSQSKIES